MTLDQDFSQLNLSKGLSREAWRSLELSWEKSMDPQKWISDIKCLHPEIPEKALEAGFYHFAAHLECKSPLKHVRALILSSQKASALKFVSELSEGPEKTLSEMILERTSGRNEKLFLCLSSQIEILISKLPNLEDQIDARLQWCFVLFQLEKWNELLEAYKKCFDLAESAGLLGVKAITSFNIATVYENLGQKIEAKTWLWVAQKELQNYSLDHLLDSLLLYEIQVDLKELADEKVIEKAQRFLQRSNLGLMQTIRALQALAESQTELGFILDAEMTLSQSRKLIQQNQYEQYSGVQEVLELNLASIIHRPSRFQNRKNLEKYSLQIHHKAALARWAFKMNDSSRVLRLASEVRKEAGDSEVFEDLYVLLSQRLEQPGRRARTLESQIFKSWINKQWRAIEFMAVYLEVDQENKDELKVIQSPWRKALNLLCSGLVCYRNKNMAQAQSHWEDLMKISRNQGLERLESLAATLLRAALGQAVKSIHDLCPEELAFYETLVSKLMDHGVSVSKNEKGQIELGTSKADLVFDENRNEVSWMGQTVTLQNQPVLAKIVKALFTSAKGLSKEEMVKEVWGLEYHPLHHDPMIYAAIGRLRDLIPVEMLSGIYRLPSNLKWSLVTQNKKDSLNLNARQKRILDHVENQTSLSRKETVALLKVSERTALRELTQLVRMGLLTQSGSGRGVHYTKWNEGA